MPRFVICNEGYTIERLIHGMDASYNDVQPWNYKDLVNTFGGTSKDSKTFQVKTKLEAENLLTNKEFASAPYLQVRKTAFPSQFTTILIVASLWKSTCLRKMHPRLFF